MLDDQTVQVNFGRPVPIFPLVRVTLLPQQVLPLHIFEPRYKQMISESLDGSGQIAMAVFRGRKWKLDYHGKPPIMPAVCVGQIVQHEKLSDDRYNVLIQGVCRARITNEMPGDGERLFRLAMLEPVGVDDAGDVELDEVREHMEHMLTTGELSRLATAETILEYVRNDDVPTHALLELVSFALVTDDRLRYRLLAEPDVQTRADMLLGELGHLRSLIRRGDVQRPDEWPKGLSWN